MLSRQDTLNEWLQTQLKTPFTLTPLTGDASFRRYFRLTTHNETRVIMDAPPNKESIAPFITIQQQLKNISINTPIVHAYSLEQGFAILDDLGDELLLNALTPSNRDSYYEQSIQTLITMQQCSSNTLPVFDAAHMLKEMHLFTEWFLIDHLNLTLSTAEIHLLNQTFNDIASRITQQPQCFIHRDYHSRNIMVTEMNKPLSIIDFQDAMHGPITYDLVSLLKDCYTKLPETAYQAYAALFYNLQPKAHLWSLSEFMDEVDYCGLQRHLKVLGIFCRLNSRDGKPNYLNDLPLAMDYTITCLKRHSEFKPLLQFMENRVLPLFMEHCAA